MTREITGYNGKTIQSITVSSSGITVTITFTDGSSVDIVAKGTEEQWISIDDVHY